MLSRLAIVLVSILTALPLSAQHADFVLFGESNEAGANLPENRRAVHPITAPFYNEDSFVTSDLRAWFLYHDFPQSSPIDGGSVKAAALQVRLALTDRLQFVAYKDGYEDFDSGLVRDSGWNDLAAGLKWNFLQDWESDFHMAVGAGFQWGIGDSEILQEDDELRFWASLNKGFDNLHLGATVNLLVPTDDEDALGDSTRLTWHLHADYWVCEWFSPVAEVNGYHSIDNGNNVPLPFSGVDVTSLGGGDDVITLGVGAEIRPLDDLAVRFAYEMPLSDKEDLFGYRWTISAVFSF